MSYNATRKVRTKDLKSLAVQLKAITDELASRIDDLEDMAQSLLTVANSSIANIQRGAD